MNPTVPADSYQQRNGIAGEGGSDPMCRNKIWIFTFPSFLIFFPLFCNSVCPVPFFLKYGKCVYWTGEPFKRSNYFRDIFWRHTWFSQQKVRFIPCGNKPGFRLLIALYIEVDSIFIFLLQLLTDCDSLVCLVSDRVGASRRKRGAGGDWEITGSTGEQ